MKIEHTLITGATGVVGGGVLAALAANGDESKITLLIRARDEAHLRQRTKELLTSLTIPHAARDSISTVRGDTSLPNLGLPEFDFDCLTREVTHVVHSAGSVRLNRSLEEARTEACGGVANLLQFARQAHERGHLRKIEAISTVGVCGRDEAPLPEERIASHRCFHNTYEAAKAEAEHMLWAGINEGLPLTIHRPSMVVGDSQTGRIHKFQVFYYLCKFLTGRLTAGLVPQLGQATLDIIPLDVVATAIKRSMSRDTTANQVFNLCAGPSNAVKLTTLAKLSRKHLTSSDHYQSRPNQIPIGLATALSRITAKVIRGKRGRALNTLPHFLAYLKGSQQFLNTNTLSRLLPPDYQFPDHGRLIDTLLSYYATEGGRCS